METGKFSDGSVHIALSPVEFSALYRCVAIIAASREPEVMCYGSVLTDQAVAIQKVLGHRLLALGLADTASGKTIVATQVAGG